jgi:two-component SAPR family response regulator
VNKVLALYTGHFLAGDENQFWAISLRESLRNKMLRLIEKAGKLLETNQRFTEAVALYRRGLEYDNLIEEFYQRLMYCHSRIGNRGEIISTFKSCCAAMKTVDATPASKTCEFYKRFLA